MQNRMLSPPGNIELAPTFIYKDLGSYVELWHLQWTKLVCDPRKSFHGPDLANQGIDRVLLCLDLLDPELLAADRPLSRTDPLTTDPDVIQIFIKTLQGRNICKHIWKGRQNLELKFEIQTHLGISTCMQNLIYSG